MLQRQIRLSCVVAGLGWGLAVIVTMAGTIVLALGYEAAALALYAHGVLFLAVAVVATLKGYMEQNLNTVLSHAEIGRDLASLRRR